MEASQSSGIVVAKGIGMFRWCYRQSYIAAIARLGNDRTKGQA